MVNSNPGLKNSPEGRKMLLDILIQATDQDVTLSKLASKVKNPSDWADIRDEYIKAHPLNVNYNVKTYAANDEGLAEMKKDLGHDKPPPGGGTTRNIGGKTYYQRGGKWYDSPE
jgi:hypothetical protein